MLLFFYKLFYTLSFPSPTGRGASPHGAIRFYFVGSGKVVPVSPKILVNSIISAAKFYGNGYFCPSAGGAIRFYFVGSGKVVPVPPKALVNRRISATKYYGNGYILLLFSFININYSIPYLSPSPTGRVL